MTPGIYLRLRREAAGLTIADVAARVPTEPRWAEHLRAEFLALIEADEQPATFATVVTLHQVYRFDFNVLVRLVELDLNPRGGAPNICRDCGCSWQDPCVDLARQQTCAWADARADWCTFCADKAVQAALSPATRPAAPSSQAAAA